MKNIKDYLHFYLGCEVWSDGIKEPIGKLYGVTEGCNKLHLKVNGVDYYPKNVGYKPILHPLSDMTEEEVKNLCDMANINYSQEDENAFYDLEGFKSEADDLLQNNPNSWETTRYLLSKHFDLFGLIEAGLAIDKTTLE